MKTLITLSLAAFLITFNFLLSTAVFAQKIGAGRFHSVALCNDSTVSVWGDNSFGQLADTSLLRSYLPLKVVGLTGVIAIASGENHCLALKKDGTVRTWGVNLYGMLGDGTTTSIGCYCKTTPVKVSGLTGTIAIASGTVHSMALKDDSTVWTWGANSRGELGDGTTTDRYTPVKVSGLTKIIAIAGGGDHSLAVKDDGTLWAWGYNSAGQLGDSTLINKTIPLKVIGLSGIKAVAAGWEFSVALKSDSTVWTWGYNVYGQLGDSTLTDRWIPGKVNGLTGIIAIAAGANHCFALKSDSTVWAWGSNKYGQLGNGTTIDIEYPVKVSGLKGVIAIAGNYAGYAHSLALKNDGTLWAFGYNGSGQLGNGTIISGFTPVKVVSLCKMLSGIQNSEPSIQNIKIYPNPFHSILFIESEIIKTNTVFVLYDLLGNEVMKKDITTNKTELTVEGLSGGIYFYQLRNGEHCIKKGKAVIE